MKSHTNADIIIRFSQMIILNQYIQGHTLEKNHIETLFVTIISEIKVIY